MDAPAHFYNGVPTIEQVPLEYCIGLAAPVNVSHLGPRGEITPADLTPHEEAITTTRKVVFRTGWSSHWGQDDYFYDYPVLSEATAAWLVARGSTSSGSTRRRSITNRTPRTTCCSAPTP